MILSTIFSVCALLSAPETVWPQTPTTPLPQDGATIVFFGDSITQAGLYVDYIDAFLATRYPDRTYHVLNRGITSETISGTSEPDHIPRRPNALHRFARDIVSAKPDILVACFGMNDGNYFPFEPERFARYQEGVNRLIEQTRKKLHASLILLTPPPYDAYARRVLDPDAISFGYKFPAIDYDDTLTRYSAWLLELREPDVRIVDVHEAMKRHLQARRARQVSFHLQEDGIHPTPTGHWIMAEVLLDAWGIKDLGDQARIDSAQKTFVGDMKDLRLGANEVAFTWRVTMPMPRATEWDHTSDEIEQRFHRFNQHRLVVTGLGGGRYRLLAEKSVFATVSAAQLTEGLDLPDFSGFPTTRLSQDILAKIHRRQRLEVALWRKQVVQTAPADDPDVTRPAGDLKRELNTLEGQIREMCRPRDIRVEVVRAD